MGITAVPREIENNAYAKFGDGGGEGGKLGALWEMCKWRVDIILQPRPQVEKKREKKRDMSKFASSTKNLLKIGEIAVFVKITRFKWLRR